TGLFFMRVQMRRQTHSGGALQEIAEGFSWVWHTGPIRSLLMMIGLMSLVGMPYSVLMPIFADHILHGGARGLGLLMGATGVGALLGALTLASRSGLSGLGRWIAFSCGGFGLFLILFPLFRHFLLFAALLVPVGLCMLL